MILVSVSWERVVVNVCCEFINAFCDVEYTRKSLSAKLLTLNEGIVDKVLNIDVICDVWVLICVVWVFIMFASVII